MRTSEQIDAIAAAFSKAQAEISTVRKDKRANAGKYGYTYASLAAVVEAVSGPLSKHEIAFIQSIAQEDGAVTVTTRVMHSSGQWLEGDCRIPVAGNNAQAVGSAITYGRRYGLCALLGIVSDDDDDGAAAQTGAKKANPQSSASLAQVVDSQTGDDGQEDFIRRLNASKNLVELDEAAKTAPRGMAEARRKEALAVYDALKTRLRAEMKESAEKAMRGEES